MSSSLCSSSSGGMEEEEGEESFYDAPDVIDLESQQSCRGGGHSLLRSSDTLTNNDHFSTCKGDTLKTIADENFARNSQRLEYEDESCRSSHHNFDDSVSSGNRAEDEDDVMGGQHSDWTNEEESQGGDEVIGSWEKKHCSDKTLTSTGRGSRECGMSKSDVTQKEGPCSLTQCNKLEGGFNSTPHRKARRGDHLSLDNLNAFVPAVTSDSGTSFTPSSDQHDFLELPLPPHSKSNSLPSSDGGGHRDTRRTHRSGGHGAAAADTGATSPCDFFKTLDRYYAPVGTEDSGSDHSGSTNTTQETKHVKKLGIKATPRKILTKLKRRGTASSKSRDSAFLEGSAASSYTSGGADAESRTTVSDSRGGETRTAGCPLNTHIPAYHSDNYPEHRDKNFSKSSTIVQVMQSHQHNLAIWCLKFSSCGKYLAAAGQDKIIRVWVLRTEFDTLNVLNASKTSASSGAAGSSHSPAANLHNLSYASQRSLEGSLKANSLKSDDSANEAANNLNTSPFLPDPYRTFAKHSSDVMDISWSCSNSSYLLSASMDKSVRLWHIHMNKCLGAFDHQNIVTCVSFPPALPSCATSSLSLLPPRTPSEHLKSNNSVFLSGAMDGKVRIWSITEKKVLNFYEASGGKKQPITCLCFHSGGEYILVGTLSGQVLKLDSLQLRLMSQTRLLTSKSGKLRRTNVKIVSIQESPRFPDTFLVSSSDCRIRLYEATASCSSISLSGAGATVNNQSSNSGFWRLKAKYKGHSNKNSPIRTGFSRLGNFVISGSECKGIFIWSTEPLDSKAKNTIFECLQAHDVSVTAATFSPTVEAIECLDSCQRRLQQQNHKSGSSCSVNNFSCSNPQINSTAPPPPQKCLLTPPTFGDSADTTATVDADPEDASWSSGVGCGPTVLLNDSGLKVDQPERRHNNCSPTFTVKGLAVGEVFASADYTGKINVYFA